MTTWLAALGDVAPVLVLGGLAVVLRMMVNYTVLCVGVLESRDCFPCGDFF